MHAQLPLATRVEPTRAARPPLRAILRSLAPLVLAACGVVAGTPAPPPVRPLPAGWRPTDLDVAWIGHATVLIGLGGTMILTDPALFDRVGLELGPVTLGPKRLVAPALAPADLPPLDAVLVTHAHMDSLDRPSLRALARPGRRPGLRPRRRARLGRARRGGRRHDRGVRGEALGPALAVGPLARLRRLPPHEGRHDGALRTRHGVHRPRRAGRPPPAARRGDPRHRRVRSVDRPSRQPRAGLADVPRQRRPRARPRALGHVPPRQGARGCGDRTPARGRGPRGRPCGGPSHRRDVDAAVLRERPMTGGFRPLRLGPLTVWPPVVLAPMAGVTNYAFRSLCREHGAGLYVSEMITARGFVRGNALSRLL